MIRLDACWVRDMPVVGSTEVLPVGSGWLSGTDANDTYTIELQGGDHVPSRRMTPTLGGSNFDPAVTALARGCHTTRLVKLVSELPATDVG
jgi:hypothetical protein